MQNLVTFPSSDPATISFPSIVAIGKLFSEKIARGELAHLVLKWYINQLPVP